MLSALLASSEDLLVAQLIKGLTDLLPIEIGGFLILNDPKKELPLVGRPRHASYALGGERKIAKLAGGSISTGNQLSNLLPILLVKFLQTATTGFAVAPNDEDQVPRFICLPVFTVSDNFILLDKFEKNLPCLRTRIAFDFLLRYLKIDIGKRIPSLLW